MLMENETRKKYVESKDHWRGRAARNAGDQGGAVHTMLYHTE